MPERQPPVPRSASSLVRAWHERATRPSSPAGVRIHPDEERELAEGLSARPSRLPAHLPAAVGGRDVYRVRENGKVSTSCIDHQQFVDVALRKAQGRAPFIRLTGLGSAAPTVTRTPPNESDGIAERFEFALPKGMIRVDHAHQRVPVAPGAKPFVQSRLVVTATDAAGHYRRLPFETLMEVVDRVRNIIARRPPGKLLPVLPSYELLAAHQVPLPSKEHERATLRAIRNHYAGLPSPIVADDEASDDEPSGTESSRTEPLDPHAAAKRAREEDDGADTLIEPPVTTSDPRTERAKLRLQQLDAQLTEARSVADVEQIHVEMRTAGEKAPSGSVQVPSLAECFLRAFRSATAAAPDALQATRTQPETPIAALIELGQMAGLSNSAIDAALVQHAVALLAVRLKEATRKARRGESSTEYVAERMRWVNEANHLLSTARMEKHLRGQLMLALVELGSTPMRSSRR